MRFKVLGSIEVERDGSSVAVGGPQQRRLLGVLLIARGHTVTSRRLVDALWPDADAPDGAARSVMTYVSRLRAALGDGHVVTQGSGYRLNLDSATCDVDEFEALIAEAEGSLPDRAMERYDRALGLWEGEAFGAFGGEWWALAESTRLAELRVVAEEERAAASMKIGHHSRSVPALEGLVVEHPLRERPVSLLMQALVASGRRAEAVRVLRSYRSRLADETGLDPSPELVALERTIASSLDPSGDTSTGRPLRGYVIHEVIGEGSYGRVYAATQPGTERRVAIKVIRPDLADSSEFIHRFEAEARLIARLEHPHVVPLYDYWREPGGAYLVFRYLPGGTARDSVISGGPWSVPRVSQLVEEVGGALIAAHGAGIRHNDVKASNVMLDERGSAYLTDFGIAVRTEQPAAEYDGSRGDVRGLGWLLWELLTGAAPGTGATASSTLLQRSTQVAPSLVGLMPVVPEGLDAVFANATAPAGGYDSVAELVLGWRAAVGRPEGVLSPVGSDERRAVGAARRVAALGLTEATAAGVNPYKGLRSFDEADAAEFFGRDEVSDALLEWTDGRPLVTVVGASGSGKSSLVRAGLVPRLRASGHTVVTMVPADAPVAAFREVLVAVSTSRRTTADPATLVRQVVRSSGPLVVVIDQLEELWTRSDPARRTEFVDVVARLVDDHLDVRFVATIRADVFDRPLQDPRLGTHIGPGAFVLAPMSPAQLGDAITRPAARAGVTFDEAVVADLVTEAAARPGSLPLLQFTLAELYDRRVDGRIGVDALIAVGGMAGSIGRRAESVYTSLDERSRADTRDLFSRLVTPGDAVPDARRRARISELADGARTVASRYVDARLLVTDRDQATREPTLDVAHEALISRWSRLAGWIDEDRRWLAQLEHLATAARAWDERGRPPTDLYRGSRLEAAIEAIDDGRAISATERNFVDAGRDARDIELRTARRTTRRLRILAAVTSVFAVIAIAVGVAALVQRTDARQARTEANASEAVAEQAAAVAERQRRASEEALLTASARALVGDELDLALLLAVEAGLRSDGADALDALATVLRAQPAIERFTDLGTAASAGLDVGADGRRGAMLDGDRLVRFTLPDLSMEPPVTIAGATGLAMSPTSSQIAVTTPEGVTVVNAATGAIDKRLTSPSPGVRRPEGVAWIGPSTLGVRHRAYLSVVDVRTGRDSATASTRVAASVPVASDEGGRRLAIGPLPRGPYASEESTIRIVETATGAVMRRLEIPTGVVTDLSFQPDGDLLAVGTSDAGLYVLDTASGETVFSRATPVGESGRFSPDGTKLAVRDGAGTVTVIEPTSGALLLPPVVQARELRNVYFTPAGDALVADAENALVTIRLDGREPLASAPFGAPGDHAGAVRSDGHVAWAITPFDDRLPADERNAWRSTAYQPGDGRSTLTIPGLVFFYGTGDEWLYTWQDDASDSVIDPRSGATLFTGSALPRPRSIATDLGTSLIVRATLDGQYLDVRPLPDLAPVETSLGPFPWNLLTFPAPSANGRRIALATVEADRISVTIRILDIDSDDESIEPIRWPDEGATPRAIAFTADDRTLLIGDQDGNITEIDVATGTRSPSPIQGMHGPVVGLLPLSDGRIFAVSHDGTMSIYDAASGQPLGPPMVWAPQVDPELFSTPSVDLAAHHVLAPAPEGLRLWNIDLSTWPEVACQRAGRNLTPDEWDRYLPADEPYRSTCPQFPAG